MEIRFIHGDSVNSMENGPDPKVGAYFLLMFAL